MPMVGIFGTNWTVSWYARQFNSKVNISFFICHIVLKKMLVHCELETPAKLLIIQLKKGSNDGQCNNTVFYKI